MALAADSGSTALPSRVGVWSLAVKLASSPSDGSSAAALDRVAEGMEMRPKDLMKKLGLESDEDAGVNYKAFPKVFA